MYTAINIKGTYVPIGIALGTEYHGFEVSLVRFNEPDWYGIYAEGLRHNDGNSYMVGGGFEAGVAFLGLDAAVLGIHSDSGNNVGFSGRALITFPLISLYVRYAQVLDADDFWELGLLIKIPIGLN